VGNGYYYGTYTKEDLLLPVEDFAKMAKQQLSGHIYVGSSSYSGYNNYVEQEISEESAYGSYISVMADEEEDDDDHWEGIVADNRELNPFYQREKEDPRHRMGDLLAACFNVYKSLKKEKRLGPNPKTFYQWLDDIPEWERVVMIRNALVNMGMTPSEMRWARSRGLSQQEALSQLNLKPSMVKAFIYGVAYLDKAGRKRYKLAFTPNGMISLGARPFDTTNNRTVFSGVGWAIWVLSPKGSFYAGDHKKGQFHHSSFLAGEPVKCGGEMLARAGRLLLISAKSGHYRPQQQHFVYAIKVLHDKGVDLDKLNVVVWENNRAQAPIAVPASKYAKNFSDYEVWGMGKLDTKEWA
jgi:hypothetical protein